MVVGLSGRYCAGKNGAATVFAEKGFAVIDVDQVGHQALIDCHRQIVDRFGVAVCRTDGSVDRKKLGALVFAKPQQLYRLEAVTHPYITQEVKKMVTAASSAAANCLINAAVLEKLGLYVLCDWVLWVESLTLIRAVRAVKRDKLSWSAVKKRFSSQKKLSYQFLEGHVDTFIVRNNFSLTGFQKRVRLLLENKLYER